MRAFAGSRARRRSGGGHSPAAGAGARLASGGEGAGGGGRGGGDGGGGDGGGGPVGGGDGGGGDGGGGNGGGRAGGGRDDGGGSRCRELALLCDLALGGEP